MQEVVLKILAFPAFNNPRVTPQYLTLAALWLILRTLYSFPVFYIN